MPITIYKRDDTIGPLPPGRRLRPGPSPLWFIGVETLGEALASIIASGHTLRGLDLSYNRADPDGGLRIANVDLSDQDMRGCSLDGQALMMPLLCADLSHASLRGTGLCDQDLSGVNFDGADLTGASLAYSNLFAASFARAIIAKVNLNGVVWQQSLDADADNDPILAKFATNDPFDGAHLSGGSCRGVKVPSFSPVLKRHVRILRRLDAVKMTLLSLLIPLLLPFVALAAVVHVVDRRRRNAALMRRRLAAVKAGYTPGRPTGPSTRLSIEDLARITRQPGT